MDLTGFPCGMGPYQFPKTEWFDPDFTKEDIEISQKHAVIGGVDYYVQIAEIAIEEGVDFLFFADDIAFKTGTY